MERCAAVREVPCRLPFFQAVGADVRVSHSDSGKPDRQRTAPSAGRTHSPWQVKSVNWVGRERTRSSMRRCETRATQMRAAIYR
eukprot:3529653-Rhodomonas_salina.4